jgi:putative transposase
VKYAFIAENIMNFPVMVLCATLGVSRSGYYSWSTLASTKARAKYELIRTMEKIFLGSRNTYGSPRMHRTLKALGFRVAKRTVERLMRENRIRAKKARKYVITTDSKHSLPVAENLVARHFDRGKENSVWLSDITYIPTKKGWAYLACVMDAHTRKIVGWSLADHMRASLVSQALEGAVARVRAPRGIILHSDRGVQYASAEYRQILKSRGFIQSMSRRGNCWDNAPMESFFDTFKTEHMFHETYVDADDARSKIFEWIEVFYNRQRIHSSLGYLSPTCFEKRSVAQARAA